MGEERKSVSLHCTPGVDSKYFSLESSAERVSHETREQSREDKGEDGERKRPPPLRAKEKTDWDGRGKKFIGSGRDRE